jgi:hypothetical protein
MSLELGRGKAAPSASGKYMQLPRRSVEGDERVSLVSEQSTLA